VLKAKGQISTVHAIKELDGVQRPASVCGRFTPEEISPTSERRETEDENLERTVLEEKKKKKHLDWNRTRVPTISRL